MSNWTRKARRRQAIEYTGDVKNFKAWRPTQRIAYVRRANRHVTKRRKHQ